MGNRVFYDQMLQDTIRQRQCPISDEVDVTTLKDYMQVFNTFYLIALLVTQFIKLRKKN